MNILFYCQSDDGQMLQAFKAALNREDRGHTLFDSQDTSVVCEGALIDAAIVWLPPDDFFESLVNLKYVFALSAGVDQLLQHPGLSENVTLVRLQDAGMARQMAEYVLYGVLCAQRNFHEFGLAQRQGEWVRNTSLTHSKDTHVGILGAGVLGAAVASRLVLNDYPTTCWSRSAKSMGNGIVNVHGQDALSDFLKQCNVIVCLLALTDETHGILDNRLFNQLPCGAYLINCARGEHLVDDDLLNALDEGHLSGAMLDVFHHEPLASDHPFWAHPRIVVTPHEAARSLVNESVSQIVDSIRQVQDGQIPDAMVERSRGY